MAWWTLLSSVGLLNIVGWAVSARVLRGRLVALEPSVALGRKQLMWLAAGYVLGCAFRSLLPMIDAARICLHDTVVSRIVIGRSVATVAELCFATQFALLLAEAARSTRHAPSRFVARALLPLTLIAELFSWSAVLTRNYLFHAIENSLWTIGAIAVVAAFASLWPHVERRPRRFIVGVLVCGGAYLAFMTMIDIPMYVARWQAAVAAGAPPMPASDGFAAIVARCDVVRDWSTWREEIPWLSLYFSTAVWISILLAHAPQLTTVRVPSSG